MILLDDYILDSNLKYTEAMVCSDTALCIFGVYIQCEHETISKPAANSGVDVHLIFRSSYVLLLHPRPINMVALRSWLEEKSIGILISLFDGEFLMFPRNTPFRKRHCPSSLLQCPLSS